MADLTPLSDEELKAINRIAPFQSLIPRRRVRLTIECDREEMAFLRSVALNFAAEIERDRAEIARLREGVIELGEKAILRGDISVNDLRRIALGLPEKSS